VEKWGAFSLLQLSFQIIGTQRSIFYIVAGYVLFRQDFNIRTQSISID